MWLGGCGEASSSGAFGGPSVSTGVSGRDLRRQHAGNLTPLLPYRSPRVYQLTRSDIRHTAPNVNGAARHRNAVAGRRADESRRIDFAAPRVGVRRSRSLPDTRRCRADTVPLLMANARCTATIAGSGACVHDPADCERRDNASACKPRRRLRCPRPSSIESSILAHEGPRPEPTVSGFPRRRAGQPPRCALRRPAGALAKAGGENEYTPRCIQRSPPIQPTGRLSTR
jgi:hypothetical protein